MRVLVTGGSGFLGSHVAEQLKARGHEVVCLVRKTSNTKVLRALDVELAEGAIDAAESLPAAVEGADAVVHCAGVVKARSYDDFERVHAAGTRNLAEAAKRHAPKLKRFVQVSTAGVMGVGQAGQKHLEHHEPAPATPYSKSKLAGERVIRELAAELPVTVIRPPAIYGPRDTEIFAFFQMVKWTRMAIRFAGAMKTMSLVYAEDAADACIRAIDADVPSGSAYFVEDGETYSFEEMGHAIAAGFGTKLLATPAVPEAVVRTAAFGAELFGKVTGKVMIFTRDKLPELLMEHFAVDGSAARRDLGWEPKTPFPEGARKTAAWYVENGWL